MDMLKKLDSDIELGSMKQFAGRWEDNRTADEVVEDIRGARTLNREIGL